MNDGVVLLHGIARSSLAMRRLELALVDAGYATLNLDYPARRHDIAALGAWIDEPVNRFAGERPGELHVVTHSMGGLVARALIARRRPANLGRVVMLGPPNRGSEIADRLVNTAWYRRAFGPAGAELTTWAAESADRAMPVDYPLGVIAGARPLDPVCWLLLPKPNDGKVSVERTKTDGMADHIAVPATHALMMRNPIVIGAVLAFLRSGRFPDDARRARPPDARSER